MDEAIYFSKVEFVESFSIKQDIEGRIIFLNLAEQELAYQVYRMKKKAPAIQYTESLKLGKRVYNFDRGSSGKVIRNEKTDFQSLLLKDNDYETEVIFSHGIKLSEEQMEKLLPYCNALDFEPYRNKEMKMGEKGYVGYRDTIEVSFKAVTDSYLPYIELPMDYFYIEDYIWPSEKLYRYIVTTFLEKEKQISKWVIPYGGMSLIF